MNRVHPTFHINLSSRYRWYHGPLQIGLGGFAVLLAIGIVWDVSRMWNFQQESRQLEPALQRVYHLDQQFRVRSEREGIFLTPQDIKALPQSVLFTNKIVAQKKFSWTTLLSELEQTVPTGLAIRGIQNDFKDSITIRLTGSAISFEVVTAFTLALAGHPSFDNPQLARHLEKENGLVDFNLSVGYRGQLMGSI